MRTIQEPIKKEELVIDVLASKKAALRIRALNHKLRQEILQFIYRNEPIQVTVIYKKLKLEQSVASQHLAILRKSKYVLTKRDGKFVYYSVNEKEIHSFQEILRKMVNR